MTKQDFFLPLVILTNFYQVILEREQNFRQYQKEGGTDAVATDTADQGGQQFRSSGGTGPNSQYGEGLFLD